MHLIEAEGLEKTYGEKTLIQQGTFKINEREKIGLIAPNGAGKTTLIKILTGQEIPDMGKLQIKKNLQYSYLQQSPEIPQMVSPLDYILDVSHPITKAIHTYKKAMKLFAEKQDIENGKKLQTATETMDRLNAWTFDNYVNSILTDFGVAELEKNMDDLSGGAQKRVAIAKTLLKRVELYFLDEPTNHLDIKMIEKLENILIKTQATVFLITHDRYFLENICDSIFELENGVLTRYKGNYTEYIEKKEKKEIIEENSLNKRINLYRRELEWVRRSPSARTSKSKSRLKSFENLKTGINKVHAETSFDFSLNMHRLGRKIIEINNISKSFGKEDIVKDFSYTFKSGEKIGIIGPNGCGKSTLLEIISKNMAPDSGNVIHGESVRIGYYKQQLPEFPHGKTVIEIIKDIAEVVNTSGNAPQSAAAFLNHFGFSYSMHDRLFKTLSGGEKRRLFLISELIKRPNVIFLDEPTNDLDLYTMQKLEAMLADFEGCVVIVSHDRFFMDKIVDHIFVFETDHRLSDFPGNYSLYREKFKQAFPEKTNTPSASKEKHKKQGHTNTEKKLTYKEKTEFEQLEKKISELENEKNAIQKSLNNSQLTPEESIELSQKYQAIEKDLEPLSDRWFELSEKVH